MKKLINKLICLVRGHKWYIKEIIDETGDDGVILINRCSRCGEITGIEVL